MADLDMRKALGLLDDAMAGRVDENQLATALVDFGADEELMSMLGIGAGMKNAGVGDWIFDKCRNNPALLVASLALLISAGRLHGYAVKPGDTLWGIAKASNCKVEEIRKLNPQISGDTIHPGDKVVVPSEIKDAGSSGRQYQVVKGDTLWGIAKKFGTDVDSLAKLNPQIKDIGKLSIGDKLNVPGKAKTDGGQAVQTRTDPDTDFVARVIYAEAGNSVDEMEMIAHLIVNRMKSGMFPSSAKAVVSQKGQFSCTSGSDGNTKWKNYSRNRDDMARKAYELAEQVVKGDASGMKGGDDALFYCTKSLAEKGVGKGDDGLAKEYGHPKGWGSYSVFTPVETSANHVFYKCEKS